MAWIFTQDGKALLNSEHVTEFRTSVLADDKFEINAWQSIGNTINGDFTQFQVSVATCNTPEDAEDVLAKIVDRIAYPSAVIDFRERR